MTKADIVNAVYERIGGFSKKEAADLVDLVFETMKETLGRGEKIKISGYGNFVLRDKHPRQGRNPQTGDPITISERRVLSFKPSQILKGALNPREPGENEGPLGVARPRDLSSNIERMYYRIGEAAQLVGAKPHVLRYWESEFRAIRPTKSSKGQRVYSRRDIEVLRRIRSLLKEQGYTIEGARKKLREGGFEPVAIVAPVEGVLTEKMRATLREMRTDVADFLARLEREA